MLLEFECLKSLYCGTEGVASDTTIILALQYLLLDKVNKVLKKGTFPVLETIIIFPSKPCT
jgi:hypothetical protein